MPPHHSRPSGLPHTRVESSQAAMSRVVTVGALSASAQVNSRMVLVSAWEAKYMVVPAPRAKRLLP